MVFAVRCFVLHTQYPASLVVRTLCAIDLDEQLNLGSGPREGSETKTFFDKFSQCRTGI